MGGKKYKLSGENYGPEIKINSEALDKVPDFVQAQLYLLSTQKATQYILRQIVSSFKLQKNNIKFMD